MAKRPEPKTEMTNVRLPPALRRKLILAADKERRSLSAEVIMRLEASFRERMSA